MYCLVSLKQVREQMSKLGFRNFAEMIGHTERLKFMPVSGNEKAKLLDFTPILTNALDLRPGTNIVGGSMVQDFKTKDRIVSTWYS